MALALVCRTPTGLACVISWHGLLPQIERLCARERLQGGGSGGGSGGDQYMTAVVTGLTQQMAANVVPLLHQAAAAARGAVQLRNSSGSSASAALPPLEALLLLLGSVAFRPMVVCDGLITGLADMLAWEVAASVAPAGSSPRQEVKVGSSSAAAPGLLLDLAPTAVHLFPRMLLPPCACLYLTLDLGNAVEFRVVWLCCSQCSSSGGAGPSWAAHALKSCAAAAFAHAASRAPQPLAGPNCLRPPCGCLACRATCWMP